MQPFALADLFWATTLIFAATALAAYVVLRSVPVSILVGLAKAGVFSFYFGSIFDGTFTFVDDWNYIDGGLLLLNQGIGLSNLIQNWEVAVLVGQGQHFVYYLYNAYSFRLFGAHYFSPVALNVIVTSAVALLGSHIARLEFRFGSLGAKVFFVFLLFHPDILAWSTVANLKDILVLLLHVVLSYGVSLYLRGQIYTALLVSVPTLILLLFLRFYVPLVFIAALAITVLVGRHSSTRTIARSWHLLFVIGSFGLITWVLGTSRLEDALTLLREHFVNPVYGFIRMALTPIPFNTATQYAFLDIPAVLHWLLLPFALVGAYGIYRLRSMYSRFFLLYVVLFMGLYAIFAELQGPRHRVQLDFAWATMQSVGLALLARVALGLRTGLSYRDRWRPSSSGRGVQALS